MAAKGDGTAKKPWVLKTPSGQSEFTAFRDESSDPPALVAQVGKTEVRYHLRAIEDLHAMLRKNGDWIPRPVRELRSSSPGGDGVGRGRAPAAEQPHASRLVRHTGRIKSSAIVPREMRSLRSRREGTSPPGSRTPS